MIHTEGCPPVCTMMIHTGGPPRVCIIMIHTGGCPRVCIKKNNKGGPSGNLSKCVSKCSLSPLKNLESRNSAQGLGVPTPQKKRQQEQRKIRKSETLHCVPRRHGGGLYIATLLSEHTTCQPHYRKRRRKTEQQDNYMKIIVFPSEITITSR